jgi:ADP-heptose:LPS heptosyltransferase
MMVLPLLRALRASRPDAELTFVAREQYLPLLETWAIADRLHPLPRRGAGYFAHFRALRTEYPDVWLLFTHSLRGDVEAWLAGCRQRFGIVRAGRARPLLTHSYPVPLDFDESAHHQIEYWEDFLRHFGLNQPPERRPITPLNRPPSSHPQPIGLIPGSENMPAKRWPVHHWRSLIEALPGERFVLFGTANDVAVVGAVAAGFDDRIENLAGRTDLPAFADRLRSCRLLVTNDTGGMHLANALGLPLIALFGPTNPVRTGPVFAAPVRVIQPPGCPRTGGALLEEIRPETIVAALREAQTEWQVAGASST